MEKIKNWKVRKNLLSNMKKHFKAFKFYVYIVVSPLKEIVYIGKGTKDRCLHVLSGISSNYYLNRDHFLGIVHKVYIYDIFEDEQEALNIEEILHKLYNPKYSNISDHKYKSVNTGGKRSVCVITIDRSKYSNFSPTVPIPRRISKLDVSFLEDNLSSSYRVLIANLIRNEHIVFPKSKFNKESLLKKDKRRHSVNLSKIWDVINLLEELNMVEIGEYNKFPTVKLLPDVLGQITKEII